MADFAGFAPTDLANYFGITEAQANALINVVNGGQPTADLQGIDPSRLGPTGDITGGLENLSAHPMGSHYHSSLGKTLGNIGLNFATGGYYGLAQGLLGASQTGKLGDVYSGFNNLGPYGSVVNPVSPQAAQAGNLAGAGAGVGGGLTGGFQAGGFGANAGSTLDPAYFGFEPGTLGSAGTTEFGQFGGIPNSAGFAGGPAASLAGGVGSAGSGTGMTGSALGAGAAYQGGKMLSGLLSGGSPGGPNIPAAFPVGGALPGGPTPAQLGAIASEKHPGLAPWYGMRQKGQTPPGGIAEPTGGSQEAMAMMMQNPAMWMRG